MCLTNHLVHRRLAWIWFLQVSQEITIHNPAECRNDHTENLHTNSRLLDWRNELSQSRVGELARITQLVATSDVQGRASGRPSPVQAGPGWAHTGAHKGLGPVSGLYQAWACQYYE